MVFKSRGIKYLSLFYLGGYSIGEIQCTVIPEIGDLFHPVA